MSPLLPLLLVSPVRWTCLTFIKITRLKMEHCQNEQSGTMDNLVTGLLLQVVCGLRWDFISSVVKA